MIVNRKTYNKKVKLIEKYSQLILLSIFQYARILDVISCRIDPRQFIVLPVNKWLKLTTTALRIILLFSYCWDVVPFLYNDLKETPRSFQHMFSLQQILSVAVFSIALLFLRERDELKIITMINRFIKLNNRLSELTCSNILVRKKFIIFTSLKGCITILGYINELPTLLNVESLNLNRWFITVIGVFMWLGSMFVLDSCYLGFLIIGLMYDNLGSYLQIIMKNLLNIEKSDSLSSALTSYHRITLVCDYSDKLDIISKIYSRLYTTTKEFIAIFQWHILYYIYYNFMVIFLLLNHFIWQYMQSGYIDIIEILMVMVKIGNLTLIIVCANYVVEQSEMPNRSNIDVICSDVDVRWDASVSNFQYNLTNADLLITQSE